MRSLRNSRQLWRQEIAVR